MLVGPRVTESVVMVLEMDSKRGPAVQKGNDVGRHHGNVRWWRRGAFAGRREPR